MSAVAARVGLDVPQPVVGRRDAGHDHAEADGRDLGAVQEVRAQEADGHKGVEEVEEAASADHGGAVVVGERGGDGKRNHAGGHARARDYEDDTAAEAVDAEEGQERRQELPGQGAARQDARKLGAHAEVVLEQDGGVDADQVGARHLLEKLQQDAEAEAVQQLVLVLGVEQLGQLGAVAGGLLERELDARQLGLYLDRVLRETAQHRQHGEGLGAAVLGHQPARALGEEVDGAAQDEREQNCNGNWRAPGDGAVAKVEESELTGGFRLVDAGFGPLPR